MNNQKQCTDGQLGDTGLTVIISCHGEGGVAANFSRSEECTPPYLRNAAPLPSLLTAVGFRDIETGG